jgi:cell division protein FtsB
LALPGLGAVIGLVRRVDRLFENVEKTQLGLEALEKRVSAIEDRMKALESREELLVEKTRTAASVAASGLVNSHLVDIARRIGALEAGQGTQRRLD